MSNSDLAHIIDFRDESNCENIRNAKPGEKLDIKTRLERPSDSTSVKAEGYRSEDGSSFEVTVLTENGPDKHSWTWEFLLNAVRVHRGTPG